MRHVRPTEVGQRYYSECLAILASIDRAEQIVSGPQSRTTGRIKLSVPISFGRLYMVQRAAAFLREYPALRIELDMNDRPVDLIKEGYDLAIRTGQLTESRLVARKIGRNHRALVATPRYLAMHGVPRLPRDLARHNCICARDPWTLRGPQGDIRVQVTGNLLLNNAEAAREAVLADLGIGVTLRRAIGTRGWAMQASKSSSKHATAAASSRCQVFTNSSAAKRASAWLGAWYDGTVAALEQKLSQFRRLTHARQRKILFCTRPHSWKWTERWRGMPMHESFHYFERKPAMPTSQRRKQGPATVAACIALFAAAMTSASASVISLEPTLPVLGVPYASSTGAGCFPLAGVCVAAGSFTPVSLVSSTFDLDSQSIVTNVSYSGMLTDLANNPIGPVILSGTMEQEVLGRTFATQLGAWQADLIALSLSGPVLGHTMTLMLDASTPSTGNTSIVDVSNQNELAYRIDSFFDVFVELRLDTIPPLVTTRGPLRVSLVSEPGSLALLGLGLAGLAWGRRRKVPTLS